MSRMDFFYGRSTPNSVHASEVPRSLGLRRCSRRRQAPAAASIFRTEAAGHDVRALSIGLLFGTFMLPSRESHIAISASARLESFVPSSPLPPEEGLLWANAAESVSS